MINWTIIQINFNNKNTKIIHYFKKYIFKNPNVYLKPMDLNQKIVTTGSQDDLKIFIYIL